MTLSFADANPQVIVESLYSEGKLTSFDQLPLTKLSTIDWSNPEIGASLLASFSNPKTDQASRRPELTRIIVDWIESIAGPISKLRVLDLFCGAGVLPFECASRGAPQYCGVDVNSILIFEARRSAPAIVTYHCSDAVEFLASSELCEFSVVFLLYECLNALGKNGAIKALSLINERCTAGTWVFGDIRSVAHFHGLVYEVANNCPFISNLESDFIIREYGYTSNLNFFGSRYISLRRTPPDHSDVYSMLQLYGKSEFEEIVNAAGLQLVTTERLLHGKNTDVLECSANIFFAARVRGQAT